MPKATFTHRAETSRGPDVVWERLQQAETWANIGPVDKVWDPEHDAAGSLLRYKWSSRVGPTRYRGTAEVVASDDGRMMQLDLDGGEVAGVLTTSIESTADGAVIAVTLDITSKGTLSSMFFPLVADAVGRGLPEQVVRFATSIDAA